MQTVEALRENINSVEDLHTVVKTMKTLAAVSIRQYERAVESLSGYYRNIELGLHVVLKDGVEEVFKQIGSQGDVPCAIILGSDQGLCGRFNEQIVNYALDSLNGMEPRKDKRLLLCVGVRAGAHLEEAGQQVDEYFSVPGSLKGVTPSVQSILIKLDELQAKRGLSRILVYYNESLPGAKYRSSTMHLLPLDRAWLENITKLSWPTRILPIFTMDRSHLFDSLIRQYLFVSVYRALAESLACENAARLSSMQVAGKNIEERLEELNARLRDQRQSSITGELLDLMTGIEALRS
ncbi:MAG: ATP synthase subunit gamma [Peptococcaceae bacterium BRH_c4b]|nr:MAG: ATP synthase subunit gamma [Peptococcaceae bacterium BRH_c4b]